MADTNLVERIARKIERLPPARRAEVEDFVDFLQLREADRDLRAATARASEPAFAALWDNDDDAEYDRVPAG